jgi:hypothetical protein
MTTALYGKLAERKVAERVGFDIAVYVIVYPPYSVQSFR